MFDIFFIISGGTVFGLKIWEIPTLNFAKGTGGFLVFPGL